MCRSKPVRENEAKVFLSLSPGFGSSHLRFLSPAHHIQRELHFICDDQSIGKLFSKISLSAVFSGTAFLQQKAVPKKTVILTSNKNQNYSAV